MLSSQIPERVANRHRRNAKLQAKYQPYTLQAENMYAKYDALGIVSPINYF